MRSRTLRSAAGLAAAVAFATTTQAQVDWKSPGDAPPASIDNRPAAEKIDLLAARADARRAVLSFARPIEADERAALEAAGVTLLDYVGANSYFVSLAADATGDAITDAAPVADASAIATDWKLSELLADEAAPVWLAEGPVAQDQLADDVLVPLYVVLHGDAEIDPGDENLVAPLGGRVVSRLVSVNGIVAEVPKNQIRALAGDDRVQWIEPPIRMDVNNDSNRAITQADQVQASPYNLDGTGVTVLVFDGGTVLPNHQDYASRMTVIDGTGTSYHATHVAGTVGGDGTASAGTYAGMAPNATLLSAGLQTSGTGIFLYDDPGDIETDFGTAINTYGASIANASLGTNTASNGFPCSLHGQYGVTATVLDNVVRGSLGEPIIVTWAAGNERGNGTCGTGFWTTAPPANAKNPIIVGALNSNNDSVTSFTSFGPTDDGRLKPDVSGPGCQSNGDGGVTSPGDGSSSEYITLCGTSMAAPTVAGLSALMVEDFHAQFGPTDPSNALIKGTLIHTAGDTGNAGPDFQTGYGSVRVRDAVDQLRSGNWDQSSVGQSEIAGYTINVPGGSPLKLTLVWDDVPGTPNIGTALVNDLDLRVVDPNGVQHHVWTLDPSNPAAAAVRTQPDHLNNVEQVVVDNPTPGTWRVEVAGYNVPAGPQNFALISGADLSGDTVNISVTSTVPPAQLPATGLGVDSQLTIVGDSLVPGSVMLNYRADGGAFSAVPATDNGGGVYSATVPGASCGDVIEFYMSAEGALLGTVTDPAGGDADPYIVNVGSVVVNVDHDFEASDGGWTVGAPGDSATTGVWERADPQWTGAQPEDDASDSGVNCWVTQAPAGDGLGTFDIDGGDTTLVTDVMDLAGLDAVELSFWVWYSNDTGNAPNADQFDVEISYNGGGSWSNLMTIGPSGAGTQGNWNRYAFDVASPTSQVQLRFRAGDQPDGSIVEALVDEFTVTSLDCVPPSACSEADITTTGAGAGDPGYGVPDGQVTGADINYYVNAWVGNDAAIADLTTTGAGAGDPGFGVPDGQVTGADINYYVNLWVAGCP